MDKCSRPVARNTGAWLGLSQSHETMKCVPGSQGRGGGGVLEVYMTGGGGSDQFFFGGGRGSKFTRSVFGSRDLSCIFFGLKKIRVLVWVLSPSQLFVSGFRCL